MLLGVELDLLGHQLPVVLVAHFELLDFGGGMTVLEAP